MYFFDSIHVFGIKLVQNIWTKHNENTKDYFSLLCKYSFN